jgi:hypothetical protein
MASELIKNLGEVKEEAHSMLNTLRAVKGPAYAQTVHSLLLIKQVASISGMLCGAASKANKPLASVCGNSLSDALQVIASSLQEIGQISDEEWAALTKDAMAMSASVDGLLQVAVDTASTGSGFGGRDAE